MECPQIPKIRIPTLMKRIYRRRDGKRLPLSGMMEPTWRCNLNCVHCYCNLPANDKEAKEKELSYKESCKLIDELAEEGCLWLVFTGGEPLLRKDFLDIYGYAKRKGIMVSLFTNGTMITPKVADYLAEYPPRYVEITLYGITKDTYEKITRTSGSFKNCLRGIRLLLERKVKLELKTMVMTLNRHEVSAIREFAKGLGLKYRFDGLIHPRLDGSRKVLRYRLAPEELVELEAEDKRWLRAAAKRLPETLGLRPTNNLYNCGGALGGGFQIDPSGQLGVCASLRLPNYDLRQGCFHQGWYSVLPRLAEIKRSKDTQCSRCPIVSLCWLCPASSFLETGDPEARVEYYCRIAHLRYKILTGKEVNEEWRKEPIEDQQLRSLV